MNCKHCGIEIIQGQYYAESDDDYKERLRSQFCRRKCARLHTPSPAERGKPSLGGMSGNHSRPEMRAQIKEVPVVDEKYMAWIRSLPCLICGGPAQSHHQNKRKEGRKGGVCSSYRTLPICCWHHTLGGTPALPGSYHGSARLTGWEFWNHYGIDVEATITNLNEKYNQMLERRR